MASTLSIKWRFWLGFVGRADSLVRRAWAAVTTTTSGQRLASPMTYLAMGRWPFAAASGGPMRERCTTRSQTPAGTRLIIRLTPCKTLRLAQDAAPRQVALFTMVPSRCSDQAVMPQMRRALLGRLDPTISRVTTLRTQRSATLWDGIHRIGTLPT